MEPFHHPPHWLSGFLLGYRDHRFENVAIQRWTSEDLMVGRSADAGCSLATALANWLCASRRLAVRFRVYSVDGRATWRFIMADEHSRRFCYEPPKAAA